MESWVHIHLMWDWTKWRKIVATFFLARESMNPSVTRLSGQRWGGQSLVQQGKTVSRPLFWKSCVLSPKSWARTLKKWKKVPLYLDQSIIKCILTTTTFINDTIIDVQFMPPSLLSRYWNGNRPSFSRWSKIIREIFLSNGVKSLQFCLLGTYWQDHYLYH